MFKNYFYLILIPVLLNLSDAVAMKRSHKDDDVESSSFCIFRMPDGKDPSLPDEVRAQITGYLDPLSLSRFLLTSKTLRKKQINHCCIKPLPFQQKHLDAIAIKFNDKDEFCILEICQRLPFSFKKIFGAGVIWQDFQKTLLKQRNAIRSFWKENSSSGDYCTGITLTALYQKITDPEELQSDQGRQSFLEDTPKRRKAIKTMRPLLLFAYLTQTLGAHSKSFFPNIRDDKDFSFSFAIKDMLCAFDCYEASIAQGQLLLAPRIDFALWGLRLFNALWEAKIYHDMIGFDLSRKKISPQKFRYHVQASLNILTNYWDHTLDSFPYESHTKHSLRSMGETMNRWLVEITQMMGQEHFSGIERKDRFSKSIKKTINESLHDILLRQAPPQVPKEADIPTYQKMAFYWIEATALATDDVQKATAYANAGLAKKYEASLLRQEADREKEIEACAQSALYYIEAAILYSDATEKAEVYFHAGISKLNEALLLSDERDRERKFEACAQSALYYIEAATLYTDPAEKAEAYRHAGFAKWNEADLFNKDTERQKKVEAWAQSARYFAEEADSYTDPAEKAEAYRHAGIAKKNEARLFNKDTERQKKVEAWGQSARYFAEAADSYTDPAKKAAAYQDAGFAKRKEAQLFNKDTERQKKVEAWGQSALHYAEAATLYTDPAKKAEAHQNAGLAKENEAWLLSEERDGERKVNAWAQSARYFAKAATLYTGPAQKAEAYKGAAQAKWKEAKLLTGPQRLNSAQEAYDLWGDNFSILNNDREANALQKYNSLLWSSVIFFKVSQWDETQKDERLQSSLEKIETASQLGVSLLEEKYNLRLSQGILDSLHSQTEERGKQNLQALASWAEKQTSPMTLSIFCGKFSLEDLKKGPAILDDQRIKDFCSF